MSQTQLCYKNIKLAAKRAVFLFKNHDISYTMKEKLHKELHRLAKHILAANDSSEISSLYEASKSLYEKLAVLKFIERELEDPTLDVEKNSVADKFKQMANEVLAGNELVSESNPHLSDIITPGIDTIIDMVLEMPFKEVPHKEPTALESLSKHTQTIQSNTVNGYYGKELLFGLNDRIAFLNQLFNGEEEAFKRVISQLSTIETEERALSFIKNLVKPEYGNWQGKEAYEDRFVAIICQKYK